MTHRRSDPSNRTVMCLSCVHPCWYEDEEPYVPVWRCLKCRAYAECDMDSGKPIGTPVKREVHGARMMLTWKLYDPLVLSSVAHPGLDEASRTIIKRAARKRINEWIRHHVGIEAFDLLAMSLDQLRATWRCLQGVDYVTIHEWSVDRDKRADDPKAPQLIQGNDR